MWKPKRVILFFLYLLLFAGLGNAEDGGQKAKLELHLWRVPPKGSTDIRQRVDREVFDLFLKENPHIEVKTLVPLKIQGQAAEGNEFLAVAGGMAPDVFFLFGRKVGDYIDQGFLAPLNENFENDFAKKGILYTGCDAPDRIWELCIKDGKIYAVPGSYYFMALMYRKDLFAKAGLDPNNPPKTWDQMWRMGKKLTFIPSKEPDAPSDSIPVYGYQLLRGTYQGWHFLQFIWSGGGTVVQPYRKSLGSGELVKVFPEYFPFRKLGIELLNQDYYEEFYKKNILLENLSSDIIWRLECNDEGGVAALEFFRKLASQKWMRCIHNHEDREFDITPEMIRNGIAICPICGEKYDLNLPGIKDRIYEGISRSAFAEERSTKYDFAMKIGTLEDVSNIDFSQWSVSVFPVSEGQTVKSFIAGWYLGVNATSPPNRRQAAWEYIKFITSEKAMRLRTKMMVENGLSQYVRPMYLKKYGYMDIYRELPKDWIELYERVSETAEVEPYCRGFTHVMTVSLGHPMDMSVLYPEASAQELLDKTCVEVNSNILGQRTEEDMRRYKKYSYWILGIAVLLLFFAFSFIIRSKIKADKEIVDYIPGMSNLRRTIYAWSFLGIALSLVALWQYYPLLQGSVMAFQDYKILSGGVFIGTQNFINIFLDPNFYQFFLQTMIYVLLSMCLGFVVPIILAIMLTEIPKGQIFYRTVYYLPAVTTGLVTLFLWKQLMYDPSPDGALNWILSLFGIPPQKYLEEPKWAMACIIIPGIWAHAGPGCLIYLAAIKTIPEEQYEAADLDGAGIFHKLRHIMIPNLKALILINMLGAFVGAFQASENIFVMTGGGPINKTMTIGLYIWYHSFLYLNFGFATAMSWILGAVIIGFTVIQLQVLSKVQFRRAAAKGE